MRPYRNASLGCAHRLHRRRRASGTWQLYFTQCASRRNPDLCGREQFCDEHGALGYFVAQPGQAETPFAMTWNWTDTASGVASDGRYYNGGTAVWQAFTGGSIAYQGLASTSGGEVEVR